MKINILKSVVVFVLILGYAGCSNLKKTPGQTADSQTTIFAVTTTRAVSGQIKNYLEVNGDVVSRTSVDIFADTAGKLKSLNVRMGDSVKKGQIIAEVDPSRPGMNYASSPVKASISGTVTSIPVQVGSTVVPSLPIVRISDTNDLQIVVYIAERFISKIKKGLSAVLKFDAYPGIVFHARVSELSPVVDPSTRTMEVKLDLVKRDNRLKAGMFATVKIITEEKDSIVKIPADALVTRFGESYLFVVRDTDSNSKTVKKAEKRSVVPGIEIDGKLEISEGLTDGEEIVVRGQTLLEDGSLLKIVSTLEPLSSKDRLE